MPLFLNILLILALIIILGLFVLSFNFTHRYYLKNSINRSDVGLPFEGVISSLHEQCLRRMADFMDKNI
jgi:hypothetical protein